MRVPSYIELTLNNTRCADSIKFDDQHTVQAYVSLNERMKERIEFKQITAEEIKSVKTEGKAEVFEFWQSSEAKPFLLKMKQLNFGIGIPPNITGNEELTIEERTAIKWRKQLHDFLQDFRLWRSDAEKSESDYFHQKAIILSGLIDLTPPDISHDSVLREYVNFLCESSMQRDNPIEWYYHVKRFITYIAKPNTPDYDVALEMMKSCGSPTMNVIAKMEKMFPK